MQISSNTPLIAIALRFDPTLTKFTTLPPVTLTSLIHNGMEWLEDHAVATLLGTFGLRMG